MCGIVGFNWDDKALLKKMMSSVKHRGPDDSGYYIDKNIGNPLDIKGCWEHPFMEKMRNLKFVPRKCKDCKYLIKCRGGSRFSAKIAHGSYSAKDPLMK